MPETITSWPASIAGVVHIRGVRRRRMEPAVPGSELAEAGGLGIRQGIGVAQRVNHDVGNHLGAGSQPHAVRTVVGPVTTEAASPSAKSARRRWPCRGERSP